MRLALAWNALGRLSLTKRDSRRVDGSRSLQPESFLSTYRQPPIRFEQRHHV
jgi:hypothetical protein